MRSTTEATKVCSSCRSSAATQDCGNGLQDKDQTRGVSRRRFVSALTAAAGTVAFGARHLFAQSMSILPRPDKSGIEHVVVVMMENRSFDHFFGWLPGANGKQAGLTYIDRFGAAQATFPLAPEYQGCSHPDPDHSYVGGRIEYNNGACDGWLVAGNNDTYAIGYYTANDLAFYGQALRQWTAFDRYFCSILGPTIPNRMYQHAARTDRLDNNTGISRLPTIWDRLAEAGLEGRYYYSDVPTLALWGTKYIPISRPVGQFSIDCATGNLPHVAFVDPRFLGETQGVSNDDHPHSDIRNGQAFVNAIYNAVTLSPAWPKTVLVFNYDEWGGFFDHVPPPLAPAGDLKVGNDGRLGFRVPALLVAPWARRGYVSGTIFDHTSILAMIEWLWDLQPLTVRDRTAHNLAEALDFDQPSLAAPQFSVPVGPFGSVCPESNVTAPASNQWLAVMALAQTSGWPV